MVFLQQEREEIATDIGQERAAVLAGIAAERMAVLQALIEERSLVLEAIAQERNMTMEQMNAVTLEVIDHMLQKSEDLSTVAVDHVFRRAIQLLVLPFLVFLVVCGIALVMIRNWIRRYLRLLESGQQGPLPRD
jgi:hypothetical protein